MTALLIDDEPAANTELRKLLSERHPEINVIGEAHNVPDALGKISKTRPDLIFLDIEMPPSSGFDLLRALPEGERPEVIFVTSRREHALRAFDNVALGYVLKPIDADNLARSVTRALDLNYQKESTQRLQRLLENMGTEREEDVKISITIDGENRFIRSGDIRYCEAQVRYTRLHFADGTSLFSSYSIGQYAKVLQSNDWTTTHRSFLVNRRFVKGWIDREHLAMKGGGTVGVSRRKYKQVKTWLKG